jgi:apolipoprotein N-acyltransferase
VAVAPALVPVAQPAGRTVTVALVQGNVPRMGLDFNAQREAVLKNHAAETHVLAERVRRGEVPRPDLVIWPENSSDIDPFENPDAYRIIDDAVRDVGVPVLIGAVLSGPGPDHVSNSGIVWDPETGPASGPHGRYVKRHPVPFAEYIPLRPIARLVSSDVNLVARDFAKGTTVGALDVPATGGAVRLGDVICFEVGYDGIVNDAVRAGGSVLVVQTNNATFGRTPQTEQQLEMSRLRSLETGRWSLVAATSGVSAVVTPGGHVAQKTGLFTSDVLVSRIRLAAPAQETLATRLGVGPEAAMCLLAGILALAGWRRRERTVRDRREENT